MLPFNVSPSKSIIFPSCHKSDGNCCATTDNDKKKNKISAPKKLPAHTRFLNFRNEMFWFIYVLKWYDLAYRVWSISIFRCVDWDEFQSVHYPQSPGHIPLNQPFS